MSYELMNIEKSWKCPCGHGKIVYGSGTNDWNQVRYGMMEIWCPNCNTKYKIVSDGLLPTNYPEYSGDKKIKEKIDKLYYIINNYGYSMWDKNTRDERTELCMDSIELDSYKNISNIHSIIFGYSKRLYKNYTKEELEKAYEQMLLVKYSTRLTGIAKELAKQHKRHYKTIKISNVIIPVYIAICNYNNYTKFDEEDSTFIKDLKQKLKMYEAEYYKDLPEYKIKRKEHLIPYDWKGETKDV